MTSTEVSESLKRLHTAYIEKLNGVLDEGRTDLTWELVDAYTEEALMLITSEELVPSHPANPRPRHS